MFGAVKGFRRNQTAVEVVNFEAVRTTANSTTLIIPKPASASAGHVLLAAGLTLEVNGDESGTWAASGWTLVVNNTGLIPNWFVGIRTLSAADAATTAFTFSAVNNGIAGVRLAGTIVAVKNAAYNKIGTQHSGNAATITALAVQADYSNSMLFTFFARPTQALSIQAPTSMSAVARVFSAAPSLGMFNQIVPASNTGVRTTSVGIGETVSVNILFKPA